MSHKEEIFIYTDGAASGNPGPGGYGTIILFKGHKKTISGGYRRTTNNRMELMAVIAGLSVLTQKGLHIRIITDSKYVHDTIVKGWLQNWIKTGFKGKKNQDLWMKLHHLIQGQHITMEWVKGHAGHPMNEECDRLAVRAAAGKNLFIDQGYEAEAQKLL